jgi:hypothetical protein
MQLVFRILALDSCTSVFSPQSRLSIPVFQLFDYSIIPSPRFRLVSVLSFLLSSMYPDMPDGYAGWLLRHLKSKPPCLYSSIRPSPCPRLPLSSEMSVPSLKFIHVSASVQCPVVASSSSGSLAFDSRLRFCLGYFSRFFSQSCPPLCPTYVVQNLSRVIQSSVFGLSFSVFSLVQSQSQFQSCLSAPRFRIQIPVHLCLSVIV